MKVLCIKNTTKLVKGKVYDVFVIQNKNTNTGSQSYFRKFVNIKDIGSYSVRNFKLENGSDLPEINWESPEYKDYNIERDQLRSLRIDATTPLEIGDIVICTNQTSKYLQKGRKYKIVDLKIDEKTYASGHVYKTRLIKIQGYNRWLNTYVFRRLSLQESRDMSLNDIFTGKKEELFVDTKTRVIDRYSKEAKDVLLMQLLVISFADEFREGKSVVEWAVRRYGRKYDITEGDFKHLLNKKLSTILK